MRPVQLPNSFSEHDFAKLSKKEKNAALKIRYMALSYLQAGKNVLESADLVYKSSRMLHRWINRLAEEGLDGLRDRPGRGRKRLLSQDKDEELRQRLYLELQKSQKKSITGLELRDILRDEYNIECTMPTIYNTLSRLGFPVYTRKYGN